MDVASPLPDLNDSSQLNTLIHFYRGELGRMMIWRQRFDASTNWAIVSTGSLVAFGFGNPDVLNQAMVVALIVLAFFSIVEARRYRFYDAFRGRVRMLESHFLAPMVLGRPDRFYQENWRELLAGDLVNPAFKCSFIFALGRRFKSVYFALHAFIVFAWVSLTVSQLSSLTFAAFVEAFDVYALKGWVVLLLVTSYLLGLGLALTLSGSLGRRKGEMTAHTIMRWDSDY